MFVSVVIQWYLIPKLSVLVQCKGLSIYLFIYLCKTCPDSDFRTQDLLPNDINSCKNNNDEL